jgi:hypothetical protein
VSGRPGSRDGAAIEPAGLARLSRRWLLAALCGAFGAGFVTALVAVDLREAAQAGRQDDPDWWYVSDLVSRYDLDTRQERLLHMVLQQHEIAQRRILRRDVDRLPAEVRAEIADADLLAEERIKSVLTDAQRERFLHDSQPELLTSVSSGAAAGPAGPDRDTRPATTPADEQGARGSQQK